MSDNISEEKLHHAQKVINRIIALNRDDDESYRRMIGIGKLPTQGQFLLTGYQMGGQIIRMVGFCVQVRKKSGQFGSDMIFLRHYDGRLVTHENQMFYSLNAIQEELARSIFEELPENEDYSHGYTCCEKIHEKGFIIENSKTQGSPNTPFTIRINKDDGSTEINTFI